MSNRTYSPLRYPGGKGCLAPFIKSVIRDNDLLGCDYYEPFSGGAEVALQLLFSEYVDRIFLNDLDYCVYAFWKSVLCHSESFNKRISRCRLTVREWEKQREIYLNYESHQLEDVGFATFYLNRTNRSGIICSGGPIGGKSQNGKWKIDARFNKKELADRIERIASYKDRIKISNLDAFDQIRTIGRSDDHCIFMYADPPYYHKSGRLYQNSFSAEDHASLALRVRTQNKLRWIVSYDACPEIRKLYRGVPSTKCRLNYSAAKVAKGEEIIFRSKNLTVDGAINLL